MHYIYISHRKEEVRAELVILPRLGSAKGILINTSFIDILPINHKHSILGLILGDKETPMEILSNLPGPLLKLQASGRIIRVKPLFIKLRQIGQYPHLSAHNFDRCAIPRGRRDPLIAVFLRMSHQVHPRATIESITSMKKTCLRISTDLNIKPFISHLRVDFWPGVPLPE